jgi:GT2 family glycosyltransferase
MSILKLQCVVVLYKMSFEQSQTMRSLLNCCLQQQELGQQLSVLVYDNSPYRQQPPDFKNPFGLFEYQHDANNGGLAVAYKTALEKAHIKHIAWLLLLDQDTHLELGFLQSLLGTIRQHVPPDVCAMVPRLMQNGTILSPQVVGKFSNKSITNTFSGISPQRLTALNSAACLLVDSVFLAGGFPQAYDLDFLDHAMFYRLQAGLSRVMVLDVSMQHQLSLNNIEKEMSMERYAKVLAAEWNFIRETGSGGGTIVHRIRLLKRAILHYFHLENNSYAKQALRSAFS